MKRWKACLTLLLCLLLGAGGALAEIPVYFGEEPPADWEERELLRLYVFNAPSNDIMLLTCSGESMMVDAGRKEKRIPLMHALDELGFVTDGKAWVDTLMNTHPHDDHIQGYHSLLYYDQLQASEFLTNLPLDYRNEWLQKTLRRLEEDGIPARTLAQNEVLHLGGAEITAFWYQEAPELNGRSVVLHVTYGDASLLLTADISGAAQKALVKQVPADWLRSDVMKAPHHGITACVADFLDAVQPQFVFITNNKSRTAKCTAQLSRRRIAYTQVSLGRIVLETDGTVWYIRQYKDKF